MIENYCNLSLQKLKDEDFDKVFDIMQESFPKNEYRPYEQQKALLNKDNYTIYAKYAEDGNVIAFIAVWYLRGYVFIEHFAVNSRYRNGGIGSKILNELKTVVDKPICLEVEKPDTLIAKRRIAFYEKHGFVYHDFYYEQPALAPGQQPLVLAIMTTPNPVEIDEFQKITQLLRSIVYKKVEV